LTSCLGPYLAAGIRYAWTGVERIVAIGDLHGDYDNFVKILTGIPVVDQGLHWIAGNTHLVQTGDIMDRGPDAQKILDLLMNLEKEAETAGGRVHVLLGNHEEMNITGIVFRYPEYLHVNQFISFLPESYKRKKEEALQKAIIELRMKREDKAAEVKLINEFWNGLRGDERAQHEYLVFFNRNYGSWLLKQNAVIKINDTIFVHGGVSEKFSLMGIENINDTLRLELADLRRAAERDEAAMIARPEIAYNGEGPLWYRALAVIPEADMAAEVDRILQNLGAKRMVIAHTPRIPSDAEMSRFGGRIWIIDTGIASAYWGRLSALIIQNGEPLIWKPSYE
jgi:Icc-related predicted phosphoesterase